MKITRTVDYYYDEDDLNSFSFSEEFKIGLQDQAEGIFDRCFTCKNKFKAKQEVWLLDTNHLAELYCVKCCPEKGK